MRKLIVACLAAAVAVAPAQAKPPHEHPKPHKCEPRAAGYKASGVLVSEELTQTAGADTPKHGDDRYSGTVTVDVKKANHRAPKGEQTYTLDNDRAKFYDADHNHVADEPMPGDRVKVRGKITHLPRKCDSSGFTAEIDVSKVDFKRAKPPKPDHHHPHP